MNKNRVEAFADGVFAIIITLLVLEIKVEGDVSKDILHTLVHMYPVFISYFMSFVIIGIYWIQHHMTMQYVEKTNRQFLVINLGILMVISFLPLMSKILGEGMANQQAIILYSGIQIVAGLLNAYLIQYAYKKKLTYRTVTLHTKNTVLIRNLISPIMYALSIPVSSFSIDYTYFIFFMIPLVYVYPTLFDFHWVNRFATKVTHGGFRK